MVKLFLSHASEDKDDFVRPLAEALSSSYQVWYDEYSLRLGDSLLEKIDEGLGTCDFGVVVLSKHFFSKQWPQSELDGLMALEDTTRKVILPVWKDVTKKEVAAFSPILAGRYAAQANAGINAVVDQIHLATDTGERMAKLSRRESLLASFKQIDRTVTNGRAVNFKIQSSEAMLEIRPAAVEVLNSFFNVIAGMDNESETLKLSPTKNTKSEGRIHIISFTGPSNYNFRLVFEESIVCAGERTTITWYVWQKITRPLWESPSNFMQAEERRVSEMVFRPSFDDALRACWKSEEKIMSNSEVVDFLLAETITHLKDVLNR